LPIAVIACSTLRAVPELRFRHRLRAVADRTHPDFARHIRSLTGYVYTRGGENWDGVKYDVWRHLTRTKRLFDLVVEEPDLCGFGSWAREANAITFDRAEPGALRDPDGRVLVGRNGERDPSAQVPHPPEANARKARTEALLRAGRLSLFKGQSAIIAKSEVEPRAATEVALRAMAVYLVARRAHSMARGENVDLDELRRKWPLACGAFSPKEVAVVNEKSVDHQRLRDIATEREASRALFWALGRLSLPRVGETGPTDLLDRLIAEIREQEFVSGAQLRPIGELLDELDLQLRTHWAIERQIETDAETLPPFSEASVVFQRHRALSWLLRNDDDAWDDILVRS
jgi:hypothetical protein